MPQQSPCWAGTARTGPAGFSKLRTGAWGLCCTPHCPRATLRGYTKFRGIGVVTCSPSSPKANRPVQGCAHARPACHVARGFAYARQSPSPRRARAVTGAQQSHFRIIGSSATAEASLWGVARRSWDLASLHGTDAPARQARRTAGGASSSASRHTDRHYSALDCLGPPMQSCTELLLMGRHVIRRKFKSANLSRRAGSPPSPSSCEQIQPTQARECMHIHGKHSTCRFAFVKIASRGLLSGALSLGCRCWLQPGNACTAPPPDEWVPGCCLPKGFSLASVSWGMSMYRPRQRIIFTHVHIVLPLRIAARALPRKNAGL